MKLDRRRFAATLVTGALLGCERRSESEAVVANSASPKSASTLAKTLPSLFVGHGAPTLALDPAKGAPLRAWAAAQPTPRAILVVSAHWVRPELALGSEQTRPLIYDFSGFPAELRAVTYPAPGAPELARWVRELLPSIASVATRGWDHGVWTPLVHLYPEANVPLLQLALPSALSPRAWFDVGRRLRPLRQRGVLLLGSGNLTHNLRRMGPETSDVDPVARKFDEWCANVLASHDFDTLLDYANKAPDFELNHPTVEHFQPLLFNAGAASDGGSVDYPVLGFEYGSLSRRAVAFS